MQFYSITLQNLISFRTYNSIYINDSLPRRMNIKLRRTQRDLNHHYGFCLYKRMTIRSITSNRFMSIITNNNTVTAAARVTLATSTEIRPPLDDSKSFQQQQHQQSIPPPSWDDEMMLLRILLQRMMMGLGIVHCYTNYIMDITLCSGPSMLPTIHEANEIVLIDRTVVWRTNCIQDGTTIISRTQAAQQRQRNLSSDTSSNNIWDAIRMGGGDTSMSSNTKNSSNKNNTKVTWMDIWYHMISPISVGDVVIAQNPNRPGTICKRVLGLPGDQVIVLSGNRNSTCNVSNRPIIVPDHHVWLEGDNANNSLDSRQSGPISISLLRGRAIVRLWPLRGDAYLQRTISPKQNTTYYQHGSSQCNSNSIVIPAGYNQQQHLFRNDVPVHPK
jgi:signal peptidase I